MALNKTKYLRKKILDHVFGVATFTFPSTVYFALFSADPTDAGSLTNEISGGSYARVAITSSMGAASLSTSIISNSTNITFPTATADWAQVTHGAIMDAASAGNMLYFGPATSSRIIPNGDTFIILPGQLTVMEE